MSLKDFFRKLSGPVIWGNLLAMALVMVAIVAGLWFFLEQYTHHGEKVLVPNIKGMLYEDAAYALERVGLVAVVTDSSYNKNLPAGTILEQLPVSGREVKSGREISLTVNTSRTPTLVVPDIADNCSLREAEAQLKALGFKIGPIEYVSGDKDWVLALKCKGQNVYAGERVPIDMPVVLVVGTDEVSMDYDTGGWTDEAQTDSMSAGGVLDF